MSTTPVTNSPGGLSEPARYIDTIIAPSKTFQDIRRSASWWFPWVISVLIGVLFVFAVQKQVGWEAVAQHQIDKSPKAQAQLEQLPKEQQQSSMLLRAKITKNIAYFTPLFGLVMAAIVAGVFMLSCNFGLGAKEPYKRYFAVWMYGSIPLTLKGLLGGALLLGGVGREGWDIQNYLGSNVAYYMDAATPAWLLALLSSVDLFTIWTVVLLTLGLSIVAKVSRGGAAAVVVGWWLLSVLFSVAGAAMS